MKRTAMLMVGLLAVGGCATAQPHLNRGTIMEKEYTAGYWEPQGKCQQYQKGKPKTNSNCTKWSTSYKWHDECYEFDVRYGEREEEVCVTKTVYQNYKVGDTWYE